MTARSLLVGGAGLGAGILEWGNQLVGVAIVGAILALAILVLFNNVRVEWDEHDGQGHRRKELRITRRPRRRRARPTESIPPEPVAPQTPRRCWCRRETRRAPRDGADARGNSMGTNGHKS